MLPATVPGAEETLATGLRLNTAGATTSDVAAIPIAASNCGGMVIFSADISGSSQKLPTAAVTKADSTSTVQSNIWRREREMRLRALSMTPVQLLRMAMPMQT